MLSTLLRMAHRSYDNVQRQSKWRAIRQQFSIEYTCSLFECTRTAVSIFYGSFSSWPVDKNEIQNLLLSIVMCICYCFQYANATEMKNVIFFVFIPFVRANGVYLTGYSIRVTGFPGNGTCFMCRHFASLTECIPYTIYILPSSSSHTLART